MAKFWKVFSIILLSFISLSTAYMAGCLDILDVKETLKNMTK